MESCITNDFKTILSNFIAQNMTHEMLGKFVEALPVCAAAKGAVPFLEQRKMAGRWPSATYFNEKGEQEAYDSPK